MQKLNCVRCLNEANTDVRQVDFQFETSWRCCFFWMCPIPKRTCTNVVIITFIWRVCVYVRHVLSTEDNDLSIEREREHNRHCFTYFSPFKLNWSSLDSITHTPMIASSFQVVLWLFMTFYVSSAFHMQYPFSTSQFLTRIKYGEHTCICLLKNYPWKWAAAAAETMLMIATAATMINDPKEKTTRIFPFFISHSIVTPSALIHPVLHKRLICCLVSFQCDRMAFFNLLNLRSVILQWQYDTYLSNLFIFLLRTHAFRFFAAVTAIYLITACKCLSAAEKLKCWEGILFAAG